MNAVVGWIVTSLAHPFFEFVVLPILITLLAVFFKCLVRRGSSPNFELKREDLLVGFDLGVTALLTLVVSSVKAEKRLRTLQTDIQQAVDGPIREALLASQNEVFDYLGAAPFFTFFAFVALFALALFAGGMAWDARKTPAELRVGWIFGCDIAGLLFLAGALALGGPIR